VSISQHHFILRHRDAGRSYGLSDPVTRAYRMPSLTDAIEERESTTSPEEWMIVEVTTTERIVG
jgi:hypothetical protein